ncbi:MAG: hypothetical protein ABW185_01815, partial [Sedimenticola sp.]
HSTKPSWLKLSVYSTDGIVLVVLVMGVLSFFCFSGVSDGCPLFREIPIPHRILHPLLASNPADNDALLVASTHASYTSTPVTTLSLITACLIYLQQGLYLLNTAHMKGQLI